MTEQNQSAIDKGRSETKGEVEAAGDASRNAIDSAKKAIEAIENVENPSVDRISDAVKDVSTT